MQVFKVYFKIIRANLGQMSIYFSVFLTMAIIFSVAQAPEGEESFTQTKTNIAFINMDEETALINGFKEYISQYARFVDVENKQEKLQDALFYRDVDYIVTVPRDFSKQFIEGKPAEIEKIMVPGSTTGMYIDMAINKYLNTARVYLNNVPGLTEEALAEKVSGSVPAEVQVSLKTFGNKQSSSTSVNFFNSLSYTLFVILILGVGANLLAFNNKNLKRRNLCAPIKDRAFNLQLIFANLVFALVCYSIMVIYGFVVNKGMLSINGLLLSVNALIFTIAALSMSFLVGLLIKNRNAQSAIANVLSLGLCFLSGAFVPQELLSEKVLTIASFNPIFWYVKANNVIGGLSSFRFDNLSTVIIYMLIQLGFAAAIFSVALVVSKQSRISNS